MNKQNSTMYVVKRNGREVPVVFDKIQKRLLSLAERSPPIQNIDVTKVAQKVIFAVHSGVRTNQLDEFAAETCSSMVTESPGYETLAARIIVSNHHKNTFPCSKFSTLMRAFGNMKNSVNGKLVSMVSSKLLEVLDKHGPYLDSLIDDEKDYLFNYFGFKTLASSYLIRANSDKLVLDETLSWPYATKKITKEPTGNGIFLCERPQHIFMRVAIELYGNDMKEVTRVYHELSNKKYIHATPTLYNAGTKNAQLASCFLPGAVQDSIDGIFDSYKHAAQISKHAGGIGTNVHSIRCKGSAIAGTNGISNGLVPMLRTFNEMARYVDQGGGKRKGSIAIYIEPWHADILEFLALKKNTGDENSRARDLFYAMWIPDLFMARVYQGAQWSLLDPALCPDLPLLYGQEFEDRYLFYESQPENYVVKTVSANSIWNAILETQMETGIPYMMYKDASNFKSNQQNLGTIQHSNLCTEIMEFSSNDETAVCNLASINLLSCICYRLDSLVKLFDKKQDGNENLATSSEMTTEPAFILTVYTKENCVFCKLLDVYLKKVSQELDDICCEVNFLLCANSTDMAAFKDRFGVKATFPQLVLTKKNTDESIDLGGYQDFIRHHGPSIDYHALKDVSYSLTRNLNKTIDNTFYPVPEARKSNLRHRPIGIGVQGLADVYQELRIPFDSARARDINRYIFETIYYGAMQASIDLSKERSDQIRRILEVFVHVTARIWRKKTNGVHPLKKNKNIRLLRMFTIEVFRPEYWKSLSTEVIANEIRQEMISLCLMLNIQEDIETEFFHNFFHSSTFEQNYETFLGEFYSNCRFGTYTTYDGSPLSQGKFQFDLWDEEIAGNTYRGKYLNEETGNEKVGLHLGRSGRWDWDTLRNSLLQHGARNSLLLAPMPTASTSQIMGNNECFEPWTANLYTRRTKAGEFIVMNKRLIDDLSCLGMWNSATKESMMSMDGSIQHLQGFPQFLKDIYKTVWEISQKALINQASDRGEYVCQSQSMNLYLPVPTYAKMSAMHFYGFRMGLKTGSYYIHTRPAAQAQKFTLSVVQQSNNDSSAKNNSVVEDVCESCSA